MRHARFQEEDSSEDSFLDVVANVVGVLIILVMLVGAQASRSVLMADTNKPVIDPTESLATQERQQDTDVLRRRDTDVLRRRDTDRLRRELDSASQAARIAARSLRETKLQIARIGQESQAYDQQRVELAMHCSLLETDLESRKQRLGKQQQHEYEVQRKLLETKLDLDKLTQEQMGLFSKPAAVTEVECVPTPLAKIVEGESIHLRLSKGLVSVVPLEELLAEVQYNMEGLRRRLQESGRIVETFGPLDGYRLKLTVAPQSRAGSVGGPLVGQIQRTQYSQYAEFLPISEDIGQNVEQALLPGGRLHQLLQSQRRQKPAVVVWLYTDSFDEFRPLKRALWEMGFSLATRPMRPGTHIGASPYGTRAAAQ